MTADSRSTAELEIRAAVARAHDAPFVTETLQLRAPGAGEILVRIVATSICHTDIMTRDKALCSFPIVLGHEGAGVVEALGAGVTGFEVGDHVVLSYDFCGHCAQCMKGKPSYCDEHGALNFAGVRPDGSMTHRSPGSGTADVFGSFFQQSSFATHALSHPGNTIRVDKTLPLPLLAPLGCGVQTGAGTVLNTLQVEAGTDLAVFGCGCVGLSAIMAAKLAGAANIIAVDINSTRLEMALELGATHGVAAGDFTEPGALVAHVKSMSSAGGCHYAIDTSGVPAVLRQAFDCCRPLGVTAMIAPGMPGTEVSIEMLGLLPGKSLRGVVQGDSVSRSFIPRLIELWRGGRFPFDRLITQFQSLDSLEAAAQAMSRGEIVKPVVIIDPDYKV